MLKFYTPGIRVIFWDLKDEFLSYLYRGNVEVARLEGILVHLDTVRSLTQCGQFCLECLVCACVCIIYFSLISIHGLY